MENILTWIDDLIIYCSTVEEHLSVLQTFFQLFFAASKVVW